MLLLHKRHEGEITVMTPILDYPISHFTMFFVAPPSLDGMKSASSKNSDDEEALKRSIDGITSLDSVQF